MSEAGRLFGLGLGLGVVHVLSGPDHLSALATLAVDGRFKAFWVGVRWGLGHSLGLIVIAAVFISLAGKFDLDAFSAVCEYIVGGFMLALGALGLLRAQRLRGTGFAELRDDDGGGGGGDGGDDGRAPPSVELVSQPPRSLVAEQARVVPGSSCAEKSGSSGGCGDCGGAAAVGHTEHAGPRDGVHGHGHHDHGQGCAASCRIENPRAQKLIALAVGLVHGIAGPGGILGVLPAVQLNDWSLSSAYLSAFCLSSVLAMGSFAAFYGEATARLSSGKERTKWVLLTFSAALSVVVGVLWLVLCSTGQLEAVFG